MNAGVFRRHRQVARQAGESKEGTRHCQVKPLNFCWIQVDYPMLVAARLAQNWLPGPAGNSGW